MRGIDCSISESDEASEIWYVVRHGETTKNLRRGIGDSDCDLTPRGHLEVEAFYSRLYQHGPHGRLTILYGDEGHVMRTVEKLCQLTAAKAFRKARLKRIDLGVLSGIEETEAEANFSAELDRLNAWRAGVIPINELAIEGSEPSVKFIRRVQGFLHGQSEVESRSKTVLVVSQSVYICVVNVILGYDMPKVYRNYSPTTGEFTIFTRSAAGFECLSLGIGGA